MEFVDDVRHDYLDELGVGPAVEDMVSFLSKVPNCHGRRIPGIYSNCVVFAWAMFPPENLDVSLGSTKFGVPSVDLSSIIEPIQG